MRENTENIIRFLVCIILVATACKRTNYKDEKLTLPSDSLRSTVFKQILGSGAVQQQLSVQFRPGADTVFVLDKLAGTIDVHQAVRLFNEQEVVFTVQDSIFMGRQIDTAQEIIITKDIFKNPAAELITTDEVESKAVSEKYYASDFYYYKFSKPFFSEDKTKAVVGINIHCFGCSTGFLLLYRFQDKKWIFDKAVTAYNT